MFIKRPEPWLDYDLTDREGEEWRDVIGYDGLYQVSSHGRVKSLAQRTAHGHSLKPKIRKQNLSNDAAFLGLRENKAVKNHYVMHLVATAFLPEKQEGHVWYHRNKIQYDNRVNNITSGTRSESDLLAHQLGLLPHSALCGLRKVAEKKAHDEAFGIYEAGEMVAQVCYACMKEKPLSSFSRGGQATINRLCRSCKDARHRTKASEFNRPIARAACPTLA